MLKVACNVCRKDLPNIGLNDPIAHLCQKCAPFGIQWDEGIQKILAEHQAELPRKINKFRDQFIKDVVQAGRELKAV